MLSNRVSGVLNSTPVIYFKFSELALVKKMFCAALLLGAAACGAKLAYTIDGSRDIVYSLDLGSGDLASVATVPGGASLVDISFISPTVGYAVGFLDNKVHEINLQTGAHRVVTADAITTGNRRMALQ